jgi:CRISPR-associated protein Csb1
MPETNQRRKVTSADVLSGESPLVLTATLVPVAGLDRFQPAGFPEVGHVIYKAPRKDGSIEHICIVDSAASMANHLESVCMRGPHDPDLVADLAGMPYIRCVTGPVSDGKLGEREVVVTSLTEGHRIASSYFLVGEHLTGDSLRKEVADILKKEEKQLKDQAKNENDEDKKKDLEKRAKAKAAEARKTEADAAFQSTLADEFELVLADSKKAHPPASKWWKVFQTIFKYDPNALVHGVLFPQWQIKIARALTAHLEALGAGRVDRSGVKFDRLGKTTSGQPIFAVDDATAREIRATFVLDVALIRSFGRKDAQERQFGLNDAQKEFLVALALWKIDRLLHAPFRFRSDCHLQLDSLKSRGEDVEIHVDIKNAVRASGFPSSPVTDVYWPTEELYRQTDDAAGVGGGDNENAEGPDEEDKESEE